MSHVLESGFFTRLLVAQTRGGTYYSRALRGVVMMVVFFPSFLAVVLPFSAVSASADVVVVANDVLVILVVMAVVWHCSEWSWNWLDDLVSAKQSVLNHVNSLLLSLDRANTPPTLLLGAREVRRIMALESIAIAGCLVGSVASVLVMMVSRKWIVVHPERQDIVFSSLNMSVYMLWSFFRLIRLCVERMKQAADVVLAEELEYNLLTTRNIDSFIEHYDSRLSASQLVTIIWPFRVSQSRVNKGDGDSLQKPVLDRSDINKLEALKNGAKFDNPPSPFHTPFHTPPHTSTPHTTSHTSPSKTEEKSNLFPSGSCIKSTRTSNNSQSSNTVEKRLSTIFEEPESSELSPYTKIKHVQPIRPKSYKLELANGLPSPEKPKSFLSLHGIPFKSQIRSLMTRHKVQNLEGDRLGPRIEHIADYTEEDRTCHPDIDIDCYHNLTIVDLLYELVTALRHIRDNYSVVEVIRNPSLLMLIYQKHLHSYLSHFSRFFLFSSYIQITKELIWQAARKYVLSSTMVSWKQVNDMYAQVLSKVKGQVKLVLFITVKLPTRFMSVVISLIFFAPKLFVRVLVVSPFLCLYSSLEQKIKREPREKSSDLFEGMREFNLTKSNRYSDDFSTRQLILGKLSRKLIDIEEPKTESRLEPIILNEYTPLTGLRGSDGLKRSSRLN